MINTSRIIDECSLCVMEGVEVSFSYHNDILHVEFEWPGFEKRYQLTRLYTRQMIENCRIDLSQCIIDDFERHTRGVQ